MKKINNFSIVCREGKAMVMNHSNGKYYMQSDEERSTVMASMSILVNLISKFKQTKDELNIVFIPRNLGGILRINAVDEWIKNGNKTKNGVQLSEEYIELAKYISDMRKWLGTDNLILKIQGGDLISANERILIDKAWRQFNKVTGAKVNNVTRPAMKNSSMPVVPSRVILDSNIELF